MKLLVDAKGSITGYSVVGDISGSIEVDESILPENFVQNFKSGYYLYENNEISVNPDYAEQTSVPQDNSSAQQTFNANILLQLAELKAANSSGSEAS